MAKKRLSKKYSARAKTVPVNAVASPTVEHFPIAGFGASAGGLEAFSSVLKHLDPNLGMAYVLVMHLSPTFKSSLAEILQSKTKMEVHTVKNGMEVKPNNVYVIPPNAFMSLVDGHLKLGPRALSTIGNFAVDYFLTALASSYKNKSIGIILSGTATDGTVGLKAIKAEGGITFAQDDTAKFPGMPKNAYDSGYADFQLSPEDIAKELAELAKHPYAVLASHKIATQHQNERIDTEALKKILSLVKVKTGVDFFLNYKQASLYRRIVRRTALNKCRSLEDYYAVLEANEKEVHELYNDFLINVTNFFRDPDFFATLDNEVFPSIVKRKTADPIRIWVAGCATGEEAYSIAISLTEYLEKTKLNVTFQIFGSDLDARAIEKARIGIYPISTLQNVSQHRFKRFFKKLDGHYQIEKNIREACVFSHQNLLKDPPFSRMDLISCQNVMIYLETDPQQKLLQTFHYALKPEGYLFLGKSESLGGAIDLFESLDKKVRIFTRKAAASPPLEFTTQTPSPAFIRGAKPVFLPAKSDIENDVSKILLTRFVQPSLVLNSNLNIIHFFGVISPYLNPIAGKASLSVLKMIRGDMLIDLRALLHQARKTEKTVSKEGIKSYDKQLEHEVTIEVIPRRYENELFYLVVFKEDSFRTPQKIDKRKKNQKHADRTKLTIIQLEDELMQARELVRTTNEEYETTFEELQSYNEETQSSNEELQSLNEELETSKEELQSANEELTTINDELQKRNVELRESQNYAKAIVDTVNNPFLILTSNLQVKSANRSFYETFKLTPDKTEGNFIYELGGHTWDIPVFRKNLNELLEKKTTFLEFQLKHYFPGVGELVFIVNAYRLSNEDGKENLILLAFINISDVLKANHDLKQLNEHLEQFAYVTSHDLQEPIRKIQTFSHYLSEHGNMDNFIAKYVDKINVTAVRMSVLLRDLLSYSVLLKNREKEFVMVDLNETVKNVCKDLELLIEEKTAVLQIESLPEVLGEPVQINQLFYNLIGNALKFSTIKPTIDISAERASLKDLRRHGLNEDKHFVRICVKDNGIGFDQKYAEKIFAIFQRLQDKPDIKGSGIGLAICKKIVEDHGGAIFAESKENKGATFWILLPTV